MQAEPTLVFNHVPKCYGTSIRKFFRSFMTPYPDYVATFDTPENFLAHPYDPTTLGANDLLLGHFNSAGAHLKDRYPEVITNERFHLFTFVREPLEMQVSLYYYTLKRKPQVADLNPNRFESLEGYLRRTLNSMATAFPCDETNYREVLGRYFFVGVSDQVERSMKVLLERLHAIYKSAPQTPNVDRTVASLEKAIEKKIPHENKTARDDQARAISEETLRIFRERNRLDYLIYRYAQERLESAALRDGIETGV